MRSPPPAIVAELPLLTQHLPGVGGQIKSRPEDFLVEELPLFEPTGDGEHLMLFIEKRGMATTDAVIRLAKLFKVNRGDIGYAGLKDKHAITRQHLTVHLPDRTRDTELLDRMKHTPVHLLWATRTSAKLRRGQLAGNRFVIHIRDVEPTAVLRVRPILDELMGRGCPNYFGEQRFGYRGSNHEAGRLILEDQWALLVDLILGEAGVADENNQTAAARHAYAQGNLTQALELWPRFMKQERHLLDLLRQGKTKDEAGRQLDPVQVEFFINAAQSAIFNEVLAQRLRASAFDRLLVGDLAYLHENGAVFAVTESEVDDPRLATLTISPSGPLWGGKMARCTGEVDAMERAAAAALGFDVEVLLAHPRVMRGSRRSLRLPVRDATYAGGADEHGPFVRLSFSLPPGAYATSVLREVMKI